MFAREGFAVGVRCTADHRQALEHLCRYIPRPAIANERLSVDHAGQVVLKLKTPYRDGTSHIVMSPRDSPSAGPEKYRRLPPAPPRVHNGPALGKESV